MPKELQEKLDAIGDLLVKSHRREGESLPQDEFAEVLAVVAKAPRAAAPLPPAWLSDWSRFGRIGHPLSADPRSASSHRSRVLLARPAGLVLSVDELASRLRVETACIAEVKMCGDRVMSRTRFSGEERGAWESTPHKVRESLAAISETEERSFAIGEQLSRSVGAHKILFRWLVRRHCACFGEAPGALLLLTDPALGYLRVERLVLHGIGLSSMLRLRLALLQVVRGPRAGDQLESTLRCGGADSSVLFLGLPLSQAEYLASREDSAATGRLSSRTAEVRAVRRREKWKLYQEGFLWPVLCPTVRAVVKAGGRVLRLEKIAEYNGETAICQVLTDRRDLMPYVDSLSAYSMLPVMDLLACESSRASARLRAENHSSQIIDLGRKLTEKTGALTLFELATGAGAARELQSSFGYLAGDLPYECARRLAAATLEGRPQDWDSWTGHPTPGSMVAV